MSNYKHLADIMKVCSILPIFAVAPAMAEVPQPVDGKLVGQTVANETTKAYDFVVLGSDLEISDSNFVNNSNNDGFGGVTHLTGGHNLTVNNSVFTGNYSGVAGGAISSGTGADTLKVIGGKFINNHAREDGGAIASFRGLEITNSLFDGNTAQLEKDSNGEWTKSVKEANPIGGGALALGAVSETKIAAIASTTFKNNVSGLNGGAIATRFANGIKSDWTLGTSKQDNIAKLDIAATFEGNEAKRSGGALYNTFWNNNGLGKGDGVTVAGHFEDNEAGYRGGAIYNDGDHDKNGKGGVMTINGATFADNEAGDNGGAIYNSGTLTINGGTFRDNEAGQWAGAIYNTGRTDKKDLNMAKTAERETAGELTIKNATFLNNNALYAGAVAAGTTAKKTHIENTLFKENYASELGAVALFSSATLNNVQFIGNKATTTVEDISIDGAGALFLGSDSSTDVRGVLENSVFDANSSGINGGAIATRTFVQGDNSRAILDISNTMFKNNVAGTVGGAFDNYFYHSNTNADAVYVKGSQFVGNTATNGGAIYNHGLTSKQLSDNPEKGGNPLKQAASIEFVDTTFTGNKALVAGGAIYNEEGASVYLSGNNKFTANMAKGALNDIFNDGIVSVKSGTTSIGGGIKGDGTLNVAKDATLNINSTVVTQDKINIDGAIVATVLNDKSFGRFGGDVTLGDTASLDLTVGSVGTYDIFDGSAIDIDNVDVGNTYTVKLGDEGEIVIETKDVKTLAADTGLSHAAAGAVAGLANSTDKNIQQISLLTQQALATGDVKTVERETAKLNPESRPVAQSVAASVQTQVLAAAAGRMSGGVQPVGRAGGDEVRENGFWAQGLFNKSKLDGQFHGYTRGFALGGDVALNRALTIGAGFAYNNSDVHADSRGHTEIDANTLFAYAQYKPTNWFVNGTLTYTMAEYTENVDMYDGAARLTNAYDVDSYGAQAMTGYDFASGVTAQAGLRYLHVAQDAYSNGVNNIGESDTDFLTGVAGVKYAFVIENDWTLKLRPELRAAVTYDFISDEAQSTVSMPGAASYVVKGERLDRLGGEFGIGLTALYNGVELSLMYDLVMHKDYTSQTGMIKFRGRF